LSELLVARSWRRWTSTQFDHIRAWSTQMIRRCCSVTAAEFDNKRWTMQSQQQTALFFRSSEFPRINEDNETSGVPLSDVRLLPLLNSATFDFSECFICVEREPNHEQRLRGCRCANDAAVR